MPPAVVKKWAAEKGMSDKEAERRWDNALLMAAKQGRNPKITKQQDDWRYVMGIYKAMMGKKKKMAKEMIEAVLQGVPAVDVVNEALPPKMKAKLDKLKSKKPCPTCGEPMLYAGKEYGYVCSACGPE